MWDLFPRYVIVICGNNISGNFLVHKWEQNGADPCYVHTTDFLLLVSLFSESANNLFK